MAALEEFLQQKYVECYEKIENNELKINVLEKEYPQYFYIPKNEGVGNLNYIVDYDGSALYLIKKSGLPNEIKEGLVGGDAGNGTYMDYYNMMDVYGVTNDLKVYYCSNGKDSIYGQTKDNLDKDNPQREVFKDGSEMSGALSDYDVDKNGILTAEELRAVSKLTIDSSMELTSLEEFYNLGGLEELTIKDKNFASLNGLQNCTKLSYIFLKTSEIGDYSALKGLTRTLKYLYIHSLDDDGFDRLCTGMSNADFEKLEYFGVFGRSENEYLGALSDWMWVAPNIVAKKTITSLKPMTKLSKGTKEKIKYLLFSNNKITDDENINNVEYLSEFKNVYLLRLEFNSLKTLKGLENMSQLAYLCCCYNKLGEGFDGEEPDETQDCLASLKNNTTLCSADLSYNPNLRQVDYLSNNNLIRLLYLGGCSKNMNVNNIAQIIIACGTNYSIPCKFLQVAKYYWADYYYTGSAEDGKEKLTASNLKNDLLGNTFITTLDLSNCKLKDVKEEAAENDEITNSVLNEILKSMPQLQHVSLYGTNIETLDFLELDGGDSNNKADMENKSIYAFCPNLSTLDIGSTYVTSIELLNNVVRKTNSNPNGRKMGGIRISKTKDSKLITDLTKVEDVIQNFDGNIQLIQWGQLHIGDYDTACLLKECKNLTKLSVRYYFNTLETLDLTGLTLLKNYTSYYGQMELKLGGKLNEVVIYWTGPVSFSSNSSVESMKLGGICQNNYSGETTTYFQKMFEGINSCGRIGNLTLERIENANFNTTDRKNGNIIWNGSNTKTLSFTCGWSMVSPLRPVDLTGFGCFNQVETLIFNSVGTRTNDIFLSVLNELSNFNNLKHLEIVRCSLTNEGLSYCKSLTNLEILNLSNNKISDISVLENMTNLKLLNLSNNQVSALWPLEKLIHLGEVYDTESKGNELYGYLNLENNPLSDLRGTYMGVDGAEHEYYNMQILANLNINKNGHLQYLYLNGCTNITENGLKVLRASDLSWKGKTGF